MTVSSVLSSIPSVEKIIELNKLADKYDLENRSDKENLTDFIDSSQDIVKLCSLLTPQGKSRELEMLLAKTRLQDADLISPGLDTGDARTDDDLLWEMKTSTSNVKDSLNLRQIRCWQQIDFYLCSYLNEDNPENSKFYVLSKEQMWQEVQTLGSPTHGLATASALDETVEWSVTLKPYSTTSEASIRWNNDYLSEEMRLRFLHGSASKIAQQKTLW